MTSTHPCPQRYSLRGCNPAMIDTDYAGQISSMSFVHCQDEWYILNVAARVCTFTEISPNIDRHADSLHVSGGPGV